MMAHNKQFSVGSVWREGILSRSSYKGSTLNFRIYRVRLKIALELLIVKLEMALNLLLISWKVDIKWATKVFLLCIKDTAS